MVTIYRSGNLRVVIYSNDHAPAHVHVLIRDGGQAKINLVGVSPPVLVSVDEMKSADVRKAMSIVSEHLSEFLDEWRKVHG